jgi:hypothetical protein
MALSSSKWHGHNCVKTHQDVCVNNQIPELLKGGINQSIISYNNSFLWLKFHRKQQIFELCKIGEINLPMLGWQGQRQLRCVNAIFGEHNVNLNIRS